MINLNPENTNLPFSVSLLNKNGSSYEFLVNNSDINAWIYQTYKFNSAVFDSKDFSNDILFNAAKSLDKDVKFEEASFAAQGQSGPIKNFGKQWTKTFSTNDSCSVYLVIPKIPPGYDFITNAFGGYGGKELNWFQSRNEFINAFHIEISTEDNFSSRFLLNSKYTEKTNPFQIKRLILGNLENRPLMESRPTELATKESYYGKVYIKLADIKIIDGIVSVKHFFRSSVVNPSRYIRMGSRFKSWKVFVSLVGEYKDASNFFYNEELQMDNPEVFLKNLQELRDDPKRICEDYYAQYFLNYDPSAVYVFPEMTPRKSPDPAIPDERIIKNIQVYRVIIIYRKYADSNFVLEKAYENIDILNGIFKKYWKEEFGDFVPYENYSLDEAKGQWPEDLMDFVGF